MNIIIVGSGKVGYTLAEQLVRESHDITVVDVREDSLHRAADNLDVMGVRGNGVSSEVLQEAGAKSADLLVAATNMDEVNMVCCLIAKNLGTKYAIARIRNPEYTSSLAELRRNLKIDMVINPESATALEISRLLRFPAAANIETFCRGRVELMGFVLQANDFLVGSPLYSLSKDVKRLSLLFCAVERGDEVIIPNGSFVPQAEDKLYVMGQPDSLDQFFRLLGRYVSRIRRVLLVGGGKISSYLIPMLQKRNIRLKILDQNEETCRELSERFPKATVICGDGTDQEILEAEDLLSTDAFVALTDQDEENLIMCLYARQQQIPKVIAKCSRENYAGIARTIGLDSVISPKFLTASYILRLARGMQNSQGSVMNSLHRIAGGAAEAMEFTVSENTRNLGIPLKNLKLKPGILLAVIVRGTEIIIPEGNSFLKAKDDIIIVSRGSGIRDLNDIYREDGTGGAA